MLHTTHACACAHACARAHTRIGNFCYQKKKSCPVLSRAIGPCSYPPYIPFQRLKIENRRQGGIDDSDGNKNKTKQNRNQLALGENLRIPGLLEKAVSQGTEKF